MPVSGDEDVLRLEVAVDDAGCVQALNALDNLGCVEPRAITPQAAPTRQLCSQITSGMEVLRT